MGETSIRIANAASGSYMATREAYETDGGANPRVIERVDFASGKFASPIGNAVRGHAALIDAAETLDLTNLPADLTGNLITIGDKSVLVVGAEQSVSGGTVTVTPIVYDTEATPGLVGVLASKVFAQPYAFRRGSGTGNYVLPVLYWDVLGAHRIGLHISAITGTSNGVKLFGWAI